MLTATLERTTAGKNTTMGKKPNGVASPTKIESDLLKYVGDFTRLSAAMMVLGERAHERLSISQSIFFIVAGIADLKGASPTFKDIKEAIGDTLSRSLHTTYRAFMEPSHAFPKGLGWLTNETNPMDNREKFIRLTPEGRRVMLAIAHELKGA